MKKYLFTVLVLLVLSAKSQNESHEFNSYFIKSKAITADRIVKFYKSFQIEDLGNNHFKMQVEIDSNENIIGTISFTEKSFFAGRTYFEYSGQGVLQGNKVNFIFETGRDLKDFSKGIGYPQQSSEDLSLFEIKIYYWGFKKQEPLLKNNITFYPILNLVKVRNNVSDYVQLDGYKELNIKHVLKRRLYSSKITGVYHLSNLTLMIIELTNNHILYRLDSGFSGRLEGITSFNDNSCVIEKNDFGPCSFELYFKANKAVLKKLSGNGASDCGFGNSVYIDSKPKVFVLSEEDIISFIKRKD